MQTNKSNPSENLIIFQIVTLMKAVATHDPFKDVPIFSLIYHPSRCLAGGSFVTSPEAFNRKNREFPAIWQLHTSHTVCVPIPAIHLHFRWQKATPKNGQLLNFALQMKTYVKQASRRQGE